MGEGMGLDIFDAMVTAEDDMDTHASQLLAAAIKLARPPRKCVAFTGSPEVVTAAHNCTMKAVGVVGSYKHYDLNHADLTCGSMSELSLINVRRPSPLTASPSWTSRPSARTVTGTPRRRR